MLVFLDKEYSSKVFQPLLALSHFSKLLGKARSSRSKVFCKKDILENFAKFTDKHLCKSLFFNKVASLRPATLLKKRLWHWCFAVNFVAKLTGKLVPESLFYSLRPSNSLK